MVIDLALQTGLRVSEMAALKIEDFNPKLHTLSVVRLKRKKKKRDELAISEQLTQHLTQYIRGVKRKEGALFIGKRGPMTSRGLQQIFKAEAKRAGLPASLSIHSARHTYAVKLYGKEKDLRMVQIQLGHTLSSTTTAMYADVPFEERQKAVNGLYDDWK